MTTAVIVALIALIIVIAVHIAVIARWSGRIDAFMLAVTQDFERVDQEILRLREARHKADGDIQRHEGWLRELDRRHTIRRVSDPAVDTGE